MDDIFHENLVDDIFLEKLVDDIFHELAGERLGWAEYKLAAREGCQQNYTSLNGELLEDVKENQRNRN